MQKKKHYFYESPSFEETLLESEALLCIPETDGSNPDLDENSPIDIFA